MQARILAASATLIFMLSINAPSAAAAAGDLDTSFGGNGKVLTWPRRTVSALASGVAIQADGKIVAAGRAEGSRVGEAFALARYNTDGTLDATFGGDGKVLTPGGTASAVAIQTDGKIVAAGEFSGGFALARYKTNGTLDATFGGDGRVRTRLAAGGASASAVSIQSDGRIVAAGVSFALEGAGFALARYNTDGTRDATFGGDGKVRTRFRGEALADALAVQSDGRIVVAGGLFTFPGSALALARYNVDGTLDATFGGDGKVLNPDGGASALAIQPNGKVVVGGSSGGAGFALFRHRRNGSLDETFGGDGEVLTRFATGDAGLHAVSIQTDGRIVASGEVSNDTEGRFALARYATDGILDDTFGSDGKVTTRFGGGFATAFALAIQADGRIVAAGSREEGSGRRFALARYLAS
ncbi:MAG TPA: delta-60 repeat domain-containing protein [Actinomycetota bacterium]|nr:delta-60 repeat domain-containing protein [Actinomycetota bacterium]